MAYYNERFLIERRGKPVTPLVSAEDVARLEQEPTLTQALLDAAGAWADFVELDRGTEDIYRQRGQAQGVIC